MSNLLLHENTLLSYALIFSFSTKSLFLSLSIGSQGALIDQNVLTLDLLLGTLSGALLLFAPAFLLPQRLRLPALILLNAAYSTIGRADQLHFMTLGDPTSIKSLYSLHMLGFVFASLQRMVDARSFLLYSDILAVILVTWFLRSRKPLRSVSLRGRLRTFGALVSIAAMIGLVPVNSVWQNRGYLLSYAGVPSETAAKVGLPYYHLLDTALHLHSMTDRVDPKQLCEAFRRIQPDSNLRSKLHGIAKGRNLILISAESLEAWPLGLDVNDQPIAPTLTQLLEESLYFDEFYDQTHLGSTSDAEFLCLQSLFPLASGVVCCLYHENTFRGLPRILRDRNYETSSFCGAPALFWHMDFQHPSLGFEKSFFLKEFESSSKIGKLVNDVDFFKESVERISRMEEPFFAFLLSSSSHHPYEIPSDMKTLDLGELEGTSYGDYLHAVHYLDSAISRFIRELQEKKLLDKTVLALYGDHEAFFGQEAIPAQVSRKPKPRGLGRKVPFIIRLPGGEHPITMRNSGGHLDVAPTLLSILGIDTATEVMLGRDLSGRQDSIVVFRSGSFVEGRVSYQRERFSSKFRAFDDQNRRIRDVLSRESRDWALKALKVSDLVVKHDLVLDIRKCLTGCLDN